MKNLKRNFQTIIISLIIVFLATNPVKAVSTVKGGFDYGDFTTNGSSYKVDSGLFIAGELTAPLNDSLDIGAGVEYQFPRSEEQFNGEMNFIPIYVVLKLLSSHYRDQESFLIGRIGYNQFQADNSAGITNLKGGLYYALGISGVFSKGLIVEALVSYHNASFTWDSQNRETSYLKFSLSFGYTSRHRKVKSPVINL